MRIRMKLVLSDAILTIGFLLSLGVFFLLSVTVARQKDLQIQAERTLNSLDSLEAETQNFLTTQDDLSQYRTPWFLSITDFKNNLETLAEMGSRSRLAPAEVEMLQSMLTAWLQIYEWYYLPAWRQLGILIAQDVSTLTEESGGLFIHYLARIDGETSTFISEFLSLAFNLQKHIDESIQRSRRWGIIFVLLTLIITFSITTRFSYLLVRRIHKVEEAVRQIANGDFSSKLDIQSGDEFEELSRNYNTLQEQLQTKLNSVLNFMVAITTGLEEGQNLDRLLSIIASSAMENTNASGAAIYFVNSEERTITPQAVTGYYPPPYPLSPDAFSSEEEAMTHARDNPIPIGTYTIGNAVKDSKPIFIRSASALNAKDFDFIRSQEDPLCIESLILAPLMVAHRVIGAIVIIKRPSSGTFTDLDFTHMQTFADYAALTIDNFYNTEELIEKREMHREITIAADIQKRLLPKAIPSLTSAQLFAFSRAARE